MECFAFSSNQAGSAQRLNEVEGVKHAAFIRAFVQDETCGESSSAAFQHRAVILEDDEARNGASP